MDGIVKYFKNGTFRIVSEEQFFGENGVDGMIRIPERYFSRLEIEQVLVHFHPNNDDHDVGKFYLLIPIKEGTEKDPILLADEAVIVECIHFSTGLELKNLYNFTDVLERLNSREKLVAYFDEQYLPRSNESSVDDLLTKVGGISRIVLRRMG